ncbi:MAG TPA: trigger factor [Syntrophorhabdaceae bacterium]|jgi:trigger factor
MKVEVTNLDQVRKKVEVILPEEKLKELENEIYDELKKQAKIRGFRPGKTPKSILTAYYKDYVEDELKKRMVQNTMGEALAQAEVAPVTEPYVDFIEAEGQQGYTMECEVEPEIELPEYKGMEIEVSKIAVSDEEMQERIERLRNMHAEMKMKDETSGAEKGDFVIVKYQGFSEDGKPVNEVATEGYPLELGTTTLLPEFEAALTGMKAGEEKDVPISFPEDYPDASIASQTIVFRVTVKEIREKKLPEVNDEFAKDLSFDTLDALKESIRGEIEKEKEGAEKRNVVQQLVSGLISKVEVPVPPKYLEKKVEGMVEDAKMRFKSQSQRLGPDEEKALEENLRKEFEPRAVDRVKAEILLAKIAKKEGITLNEEEVFDKIKKFAEESKQPFSEVLQFYRQYNLIGGLRQNIIEEKAVDFLREHAVMKEKE